MVGTGGSWADHLVFKAYAVTHQAGSPSKPREQSAPRSWRSACAVSSVCLPAPVSRAPCAGARLHVDALNNARGHSRWVTGSQSVLGQEAMSGGLIVDGHELGDLRAAVAELGARTARLDDGHANAEGIDFLRDGLHKPFNPTSPRRLSASACQRPRRSPTWQMEGRADTPRGRPRKIVGRA